MPKNLLGFSEDTMKTALLPEKPGLPGVKVYSNGNCLYNLVSVFLSMACHLLTFLHVELDPVPCAPGDFAAVSSLIVVIKLQRLLKSSS